MFKDARKEQAIELLSTGDYAYTDIAVIVDVTAKTLREWRRDPEFAQEVQKRALDQLKEKIPGIYSVLSKKGMDGDISAIRLMLEHMERVNKDVVKSAEGSVTFTWGRKGENPE